MLTTNLLLITNLFVLYTCYFVHNIIYQEGIKAFCNKDFGMLFGVTDGKGKTQAQSWQ